MKSIHSPSCQTSVEGPTFGSESEAFWIQMKSMPTRIEETENLASWRFGNEFTTSGKGLTSPLRKRGSLRHRTDGATTPEIGKSPGMLSVVILHWGINQWKHS